MFETESFIDKIFLECVQRRNFTAADLFSKFVPPDLTGDDKYYCEKQITDSLNFLERKALITGQFRPEFTKNIRLLMEVRHGAISKFGGFLSSCPPFVRLLYYWVRIRQATLLSWLGAFAFLKLCHNAYLGILLAAGWIEYIYVLVLLYVLALAIRKIID